MKTAPALLPLLLWVAAAGAPAARAQPPRQLTVLAAASLSDALPKLADAWPSSATARIVFSFDSSSRLTQQALHHAPADLLIVADSDWMTYAVDGSGTLPKTRRKLAGNRLVVVVASSSTLSVTAPRDLIKAGVRRLALAGETVPAGKYARQALEKEGVWPLVAPKIVRGDSVRGALRLAALGEADAAVVYATDARVEPRVRVAYVVPEADHAPVVYEGAVLFQSLNADAAGSFLEFCGSRAAVPVWKAAGFSAPPR